jgi:hypothetical protein
MPTSTIASEIEFGSTLRAYEACWSVSRLVQPTENQGFVGIFKNSMKFEKIQFVILEGIA